MPRIHFIDRHGVERIVDAEVDVSLMQVAIANHIPGISSDCGGCCLCHTCHALIDYGCTVALPYPSDNELNMLDHMRDARPNSRLTCRIFITREMAGLIVRTI